MTKDIVLLTVDSWRHDTADLVPNLAQRLSGQGEVVTAGAATNWVFPAILSGSYYPNAYDASGGLRSDLTSLPQILSDAGYATGGFVACNPYVSKWDSHFDEFWNGGIGDGSSGWYSNSLEKWASRAYRTAFLQKRTSAREVAEQAAEWYTAQDGPRFLWMHLMEPHLPYYPGLRNALDVGLIDTYTSIISYQRNHDDTPAEHMATQRELYDKCVEVFDDHVPALLDFVDDDAVIVAFGDHGEEFDHGHYDHERLYDECVRVPLFFENLPELNDVDPVRQIDIAPTILDHLNYEIPDAWDGHDRQPLNEEPALMVTPQAGIDCVHVGIRTKTRKLIRTYDQGSGEIVNTELYELDSDPGEKNNVFQSNDAEELEAKLDQFLAEHDSALNIEAATGVESEAVQSRLENLGYK